MEFDDGDSPVIGELHSIGDAIGSMRAQLVESLTLAGSDGEVEAIAIRAMRRLIAIGARLDQSFAELERHPVRDDADNYQATTKERHS